MFEFLIMFAFFFVLLPGLGIFLTEVLNWLDCKKKSPSKDLRLPLLEDFLDLYWHDRRK